MLAKIIIGFVVAYALCPIDLIPDFIPFIGYLDDLLLLPMGIWLAIRLIPQEVWHECLALATKQTLEMPRNYRFVVIIVAVWLFAIAGFIFWAKGFLSKS